MDFRLFKLHNKKNPPTLNTLPLARLLGELSPCLNDSNVSEIYLSAANGIAGVDRKGHPINLELNWTSEDITDFLSEVAWESKTRIDPFQPFAGGVIPAMAWRWHAIVAPMSPDGPLLVLRRLNFEQIGLDQFNCRNFLPSDFSKWLNSGVSVVFYGATGSGKTTLLVAIMREFFMNTRLGIAETLPEIPLTSRHWFRLVEVSRDTGGRGGVDFSRVVAEMMRLSPKLLVMGELRGPEASMLSDFARTGHGGVMTTMHAGTIDDARVRLSKLAQAPIDTMPPIIGIQVWRDSNGTGHALMDQLH